MSYSGLSNVALKLPGENIFPSPMEVVSLTCCHLPAAFVNTSVTLTSHTATLKVPRDCKFRVTFVEEEELVCPRAVLEGDDVGRAGAVDAHRSGDLVAAGDSRQLVAGPDTEDGSDGEVGVDNAGTVKGIERNAETTCGIG